MIRPLARAADRFAFPDAPPERLALLRILVGAWSLIYIGRRREMLRRIARTTDPTLFRPVGPLRVLDRPPSPEAVDALIRLNQAANIAFLLGWRHSRTGPVYAMSLLSLLSYLNSWSMIYHSNNLLAMHALTLGASPAADALSLDSRRTPSPSEHWRYGAPIQLINAVTTSSYFVAGVAKLKGPLGWRWATGEALRSQVAVDGIRKEVLGSTAGVLARWMYPKLGLYRLLAIGSLAAELGAPAALVRRSVGRLWGLNALGMHWGIYFVMGIKFRYQQAGLPFAPFFPLERALVRLRRE